MDGWDDGLDDDAAWVEDPYLGQGLPHAGPLLPASPPTGPSRWAVLAFMGVAAGVAGWVLWKVVARQRAREATSVSDEVQSREKAHALATATRDEAYAASLEREAASLEDERLTRTALRWKADQERAKARTARDEDERELARYSADKLEAELADMPGVMAANLAQARDLRSEAIRLRKGVADLRVRAGAPLDRTTS